jgi:hypothetical protein
LVRLRFAGSAAGAKAGASASDSSCNRVNVVQVCIAKYLRSSGLGPLRSKLKVRPQQVLRPVSSWEAFAQSTKWCCGRDTAGLKI